MNHKSKRLEEAKLGNTVTAANLAIMNAQAKDAKAKTSNESQEHKPKAKCNVESHSSELVHGK